MADFPWRTIELVIKRLTLGDRKGHVSGSGSQAWVGRSQRSAVPRNDIGRLIPVRHAVLGSPLRIIECLGRLMLPFLQSLRVCQDLANHVRHGQGGAVVGHLNVIFRAVEKGALGDDRALVNAFGNAKQCEVELAAAE